MDAKPPRAANRPLLLKLALAAAVRAAAGLLVLRGVDLAALLHQVLEALRAAGPWAFFAAMAVLPAVGVPMLTFLLPALAAFGPRFGTGPVVLLALAAVTVNFCLAYGLARGGLRPVVQALVTRLGYKMPSVDSGDAIDLLILLRVTPGVPFVVQNYLAGLAQAPFGKYLLISALIAWPMNTAFLLFGDALLHGKGRVALVSLCAVVALAVAAHWLRKHYERRKNPA